jgi:hypothetical protein
MNEYVQQLIQQYYMKYLTLGLNRLNYVPEEMYLRQRCVDCIVYIKHYLLQAFLRA